MKQPTLFDGLAVSESLYSSSGQEQETDNKLANPSHTINLFGRPSLIPKVNYPITKEEEHLLDLAWEHACNLSDRRLL